MHGILSITAWLLLSCLWENVVSAHAPTQWPLQETFAIPPKEIAVIGGGAAGTSFAYFLSQSELRDNVSITLFEATGRLGGRALSTSVNGTKIELGASIFLTENQNLYNATQTFNLSVSMRPAKSASRPPWALWNGDSFSFTASTSPSKTIVDMLWRYGLAPLTVRRLARDAANIFAQGAYDSSTAPLFTTVDELVDILGLKEYVDVDARQWFVDRKGIGEKYIQEIVQAATRVNYAQNLDLNAIAALVCMAAASGQAISVAEGNERIFQHYAKASEAQIHLDTAITSIERLSAQEKYAVTSKDGSTALFDAVVLAVPWSSPNPPLNLVNLRTQPFVIPYIHLHVTIVTGTLRPSYFNLASGSPVPDTVFTAPNPSIPFYSISILSELRNSSDSIIKIFSPSKMEDSLLTALFESIQGDVIRKEWDSYPVLTPKERTGMPVELDDGAWFVNGFESVFSTMESEVVVARKVVGLVEDWIKKRQP
ncbi:uncharacterized protein SPPG_01053 [Spizellomyces punctatus DAOM BR117]|uniref:Prenylcysteine lyase domain-containing protein n=1 Tax=Spizellomyces punctatus (strain DAOM BR117) TaxID=645134 RepID=A0A0L0HRA8_SPIPD|nr:uncharacterized protein SPPG_01053 [Spizellomyces punctatus DAOM BR117]KND03578.1 hypothetical protein SPPG_01053 [Spizellomyces punctatus DAOM BR117]|eukprot:XP_016611617.1 hypothetical protein SPPG_01053 [Spizellomyces punctatus DAOM BR117]